MTEPPPPSDEELAAQRAAWALGSDGTDAGVPTLQ